MTEKKGKVILVGAGPGNSGYLTIRGKEAIQEAEVLIYDYLANPDFVGYAPEGCETIYVGKKGGDHTMKQEDINQLLVDKALAGNLVVRLKGGDCYIFGRGSEEASELHKNGIEFEVVPGIPAAIGAGATAGIPLTDRRHTSTLAFVTGHEDPTKDETSIEWEHLAKGIGTIVFYMGVKNLPNIVEKLMSNGRSPETPVGVVEWATTSRQRKVQGTLSTITEIVKENKIKPPSLIIVGEVNKLSETLEWFEKRPLYGKTIVVTRSRSQASKLVDGLAIHGATIIEMPTIDIVPPENWKTVDAAIDKIKEYDWLVFTSVNGVDYFFERMFEKGLDARALCGAKIATIGPATSEMVKKYGLVPDFQPKTFVAESIAEGMKEKGEIKGKKFLLPRADIAREALPEILRTEGADVDDIPVYRTIPGEFDVESLKKKIEDGEVNGVTFTSSSTAANFVDRLGSDFILTNREKFAALSIGPITSDKMRELGMEPAVEADVYTIPGLIEVILKNFERQGKTK